MFNILCQRLAVVPIPRLAFGPNAARAIREGRLTARRAADLLDMTLEYLVDPCAAHAVAAPFDL
jgi:hypothetical protein